MNWFEKDAHDNDIEVRFIKAVLPWKPKTEHGKTFMLKLWFKC